MYQPGTYYGKFSACGFAQDEGKAPYVFIELNLTHQAVNGDWQPCNEGKRTVRLFTSEKAWPHTADKLQRLGFNGKFDDGMRFSDDIHANGMQVVCRHEEYQGKPQEKWDLPYTGGAEHQKAPEQLVRDMEARWKMDTQATAKPAGRPAPPPSPAPAKQDGPSPIKSDKIPF